MPKLTDPAFAKHVNLHSNDRIHIVDVNDPTHDPAGSSKYLELGDLGGKLASMQTGGILPGSLFCIFAEESGALSANNFQWSLGNGDTSQSGFGVVVPFACELTAITLSIRSGSAQVEVRRNTGASGLSVSAGNGNPLNHFAYPSNPISYAAGDVVGFRTVTGSGANDGGKVAAWFKTM